MPSDAKHMPHLTVHLWRVWVRLLFGFSLTGLLAGLLAQHLGSGFWAETLWIAAVIPTLISLVAQIIHDLAQRHFGVDVIAVAAMAGALLLDKPLAASVIATMYATGIALEDLAEGRAERALSALAKRIPRTAHVNRNGRIADIPIEQVAVNDTLIVRNGEVVALDGMLTSPTAILDESAITGEPVPVTHQQGELITSGTLNVGQAFDIRVSTTLAASTYEQIVTLAKTAQASKSPMVRLADRYGLFLLPLTLAMSGAAWWFSGDPMRALAVLVVATPCPLIVAVPVAFVSGISRAARRGILVKNSGALETLARATVLVFDKTGTLTQGGAHVARVACRDKWTETDILKAAASLEQSSCNAIAKALVRHALQQEIRVTLPVDVEEQQGSGLTGLVDGQRVRVGSLPYVFGDDEAPSWALAIARQATWQSALTVFVKVEGQAIGAILLSDQIRLETPRTIHALRTAGIARIAMLTGDRAETAETVASALDIDAVLAEQHPQDKLAAVREERAKGITVMVGDGINDAPALAMADVAIAMGTQSSTIASEAADLVILTDRLDRVAEAVFIAKRTRDVARQSALIGMALSLIAMGFAAVGLLPVVAGAVLQEGIDAASIANALRALWSRAGFTPRTMADEMFFQLRAGHDSLTSRYEALRDIASQLDTAAPSKRIALLRQAAAIVADEIVPHEKEDERSVYPALERITGDHYIASALGRTHREILRLSRLLSLMANDDDVAATSGHFVRDAQRILLELETIGRIHSAQEDELYDAIRGGSIG